MPCVFAGVLLPEISLGTSSPGEQSLSKPWRWVTGRRPGCLLPSCFDTCLSSWPAWAGEGGMAVCLPASKVVSGHVYLVEPCREPKNADGGGGGPGTGDHPPSPGAHSSPSCVCLLTLELRSAQSFRISLTPSNPMHGFSLKQIPLCLNKGLLVM